VSSPKIRALPDFYRHAVNVLFAVVIGLSFSIADTVVIPIEEIPNDPVGTGILILGYIIILTSWIGYSLSIKESPHRGRFLGLIRFGLDVLIIFLFYYIVSLASPDNLLYREDVFLYLLPMIYFVFLAWDVTKYYEYRDVKTAVTKRDRKRRIQITIDYLVIFLVMAFLYQLLSNPMFEWKARLNGGI
jgi:membrane protein CcdC involved in cytochrome C biogenesis